MKIATVVVLYHPEDVILETFPTYLQHTSEVILVDNSAHADQTFLESIRNFNNVTYLNYSENLGIAAALNIGIAYAISTGCDWVLTMDQDSKFSSAMLGNLISFVSRSNLQVAIYTPFHKIVSGQTIPSGIMEVGTCMTSGNLLNLEIYKKCGPFLEKLFIDYVDHEYCLRLRKAGYKILQVNDIHLLHELGNFKLKSLFGKQVSVSNHSFIRRYYISRNRIYLISKYLFFDPAFCFHALINIFFRDLFRIVLFEDNKLKKCQATFKGVLHGLEGKYGPYK